MGVKQSNPYLKLNPPPFPFRIKFFLLTFICSLFFFILGFYSNNSNKLLSKPYFQDPFCPKFNFTTLSISPTSSSTSVSLDFNPHHRISLPLLETSTSFEPKFCDQNLTDYIPCHDPSRENQFDVEKKFYRERHCPEGDDEISSRCLVPVPLGYRTPLQWPESKNFVWFHNVPSKWLTVYKKSQNWVRLEGHRLTFPGGGTSFRMGVKDYIDEVKRFVPLKSGTVRTVLDVGCGVATFGASLMDYNILTMSIAPRDIHEAQVQFALERGLPAMLGILSVHRLPYPSRSFDMAHCGRCLVPWTNYDGMYLMEIDRVLRPGGYWVLSGPPISGKHNKKGLQKQASDLEKEHASLEDLARRMCWKKVAERGTIAVWRKPTNHVHCIQNSKTWKSPRFCDATDSDAGWYKKMETCVTPLPRVKDIKGISGGGLEKWPKRLKSDPPRIRNGISKEITVQTFHEDNKTWNRRVVHYGKILVSLSSGKYRNIMDMNARLGGFAAALSKYQVWVMNVVPFDAKPYTLGVIYERGLIGTYTNWCEAFSTYPRTYDLIHADGVFGMYMNKCKIVDILFEMYRILRPEGAVIIRDHVDVIVKVKGFAESMKWNTTMQHSERGPSYPEKVLFIDNSKDPRQR